MEAQSQAPGFWDDNIAAQKVMREINTRKEWVDEWRTANGQAEDVSTLVELAEESGDDAMEGELQSELGRLNETVEALEFKNMLSDPDDVRNAILKVQAGAGGTE